MAPPLPLLPTAKSQLTGLLAGTPDRLVIVIQHNANLIHQAHLLLIITLKLDPLPRTGAIGGGKNVAGERSVDVGEKSGDIVRRDLRRTGDGHRSAHFVEGPDWNESLEIKKRTRVVASGALMDESGNDLPEFPSGSARFSFRT